MKPKDSGPPTLPEILVGLSSEHSAATDPPAVRWFDRRVGRGVRLGVRWLLRTRARRVLLASSLSAAIAWGARHWLWMH